MKKGQVFDSLLLVPFVWRFLYYKRRDGKVTPRRRIPPKKQKRAAPPIAPNSGTTDAGYGFWKICIKDLTSKMFCSSRYKVLGCK
ncbi:hypothetical protein H5410_040230 [Solanum commersonii]|uniref:Uncharacterized protein n=1 Tax=Solanum commersonii TaxID=4109 RepID=A0A9J5XQR9_SOLCO|nr:hypothetical protein H5410_040230 [Solanum commersonii]